MFVQAKSLDCNWKPRTLPQKPQTQLLKSSAQCIYDIAHFDKWDCQFPPPFYVVHRFTANKIKPDPLQVSATATTRTSAIFPLFHKTFILKWMVHGLQLAQPWPRPQRGDVVGDIEAPQGIDRGGHESTDLDFISTTKIMSILIVCSSQFLAFLLTFNLVEFFILWVWKFKVSTIVQVVGIILSLHAATKISSRAQGIATFASRWHALMTCSSNDSPHKRSSDSLVNFEGANRLSSLHTSYSESDLESTDYVHVPTNSQLASHMASYHKRQAFEYAYTMRVAEKCDIYSYGVVLLELLTGRTPVQSLDQGGHLVTWVIHYAQNHSLTSGILGSRLNLQDRLLVDHMLTVLKIALICTSMPPFDRPSTQEVVLMFFESNEQDGDFLPSPTFKLPSKDATDLLKDDVHLPLTDDTR